MQFLSTKYAKNAWKEKKLIHNASCDTHLIINHLPEEFKGELDCIGENMEKYITFVYLLKNVMMVKQLQKD